MLHAHNKMADFVTCVQQNGGFWYMRKTKWRILVHAKNKMADFGTWYDTKSIHVSGVRYDTLPPYPYPDGYGYDTTVDYRNQIDMDTIPPSIIVSRQIRIRYHRRVSYPYHHLVSVDTIRSSVSVSLIPTRNPTGISHGPHDPMAAACGELGVRSCTRFWSRVGPWRAN